ncbi:hypothetical protein [Mycobacterium terramassiliense]|uniref:hypothetical protein n=1 Tax=Mycobacterium terramassiliense TaxID=1841859 RepID=UPI001FE2CE6B|nr:hypothetical protein [Mycobacterium terramassiliense]
MTSLNVWSCVVVRTTACGAVEAQQLGDQSIVDGVDGVDWSDAVALGCQEANHCRAEEICSGFVAGDCDDDGGGDDVVEFEIGAGGHIAAEHEPRMFQTTQQLT